MCGECMGWVWRVWESVLGCGGRYKERCGERCGLWGCGEAWGRCGRVYEVSGEVCWGVRGRWRNVKRGVGDVKRGVGEVKKDVGRGVGVWKSVGECEEWVGKCVGEWEKMKGDVGRGWGRCKECVGVWGPNTLPPTIPYISPIPFPTSPLTCPHTPTHFPTLIRTLPHDPLIFPFTPTHLPPHFLPNFSTSPPTPFTKFPLTPPTHSTLPFTYPRPHFPTSPLRP